jgi:hypothetical protein
MLRIDTIDPAPYRVADGGTRRDLRTLRVRVNLYAAESPSALYTAGRQGPQRAATRDEQVEERTDAQTH